MDAYHRTTRWMALSAAAVSVVVVTAMAAGAAVAGSPARAAEAATGSDWVGSWSTADVAPAASGLSATGFSHQTVREIVHTTVGGSALRIRLSNVFGTAPLAIAGVHVGLRQTGASVQPGTDRQVTFGGSGAVTIPAGERTVSDPVTLPVPAEGDLAVSIYFDGASGPATWHQDAVSTNYYSTAGDHSGDTSSTAYSHVDTSWFFLDGVDVLNSTVDGAVVAFGPSTTDGVASTPDANRRYPDDLGRRLLQLPEGRRMSVLNAGISGNQLLADGGTSGVNALKRFYRDVIDQAGVRAVILWEGTNDIGNDKSITPSQIIDAWTQLIDMAHQHGIRVIGATLQPDEGAGYYTEAGNQVRETVNQWMRTSGAFDGVVDFDRVLRDPADPNRMLPSFDSGDHLHPNDAGYEAIADAINLQLLTGPVSGPVFSGTGSVSPSALTVQPGTSGRATLSVQSWSGGSRVVPWTATAPPGVTVTPDHGTLALSPDATTRTQVTVTGGHADGRFSVMFNLTQAGESVLSAPLTVYVARPGDCPALDSTVCTMDGLGNLNNIYDCSLAQHNAPNVPTAVVSNGCSGRVWLHELPYPDYVGNSGWAYCISPLTVANIPSADENPQNIQITANINAC